MFGPRFANDSAHMSISRFSSGSSPKSGEDRPLSTFGDGVFSLTSEDPKKDSGSTGSRTSEKTTFETGKPQKLLEGPTPFLPRNVFRYLESFPQFHPDSSDPADAWARSIEQDLQEAQAALVQLEKLSDPLKKKRLASEILTFLSHTSDRLKKESPLEKLILKKFEPDPKNERALRSIQNWKISRQLLADKIGLRAQHHLIAKQALKNEEEIAARKNAGFLKEVRHQFDQAYNLLQTLPAGVEERENIFEEMKNLIRYLPLAEKTSADSIDDLLRLYHYYQALSRSRSLFGEKIEDHQTAVRQALQSLRQAQQELREKVSNAQTPDDQKISAARLILRVHAELQDTALPSTTLKDRVFGLLENTAPATTDLQLSDIQILWDLFNSSEKTIDPKLRLEISCALFSDLIKLRDKTSSSSDAAFESHRRILETARDLSLQILRMLHPGDEKIPDSERVLFDEILEKKNIRLLPFVQPNALEKYTKQFDKIEMSIQAAQSGSASSRVHLLTEALAEAAELGTEIQTQTLLRTLRDLLKNPNFSISDEERVRTWVKVSGLSKSLASSDQALIAQTVRQEIRSIESRLSKLHQGSLEAVRLRISLREFYLAEPGEEAAHKAKALEDKLTHLRQTLREENGSTPDAARAESHQAVFEISQTLIDGALASEKDDAEARVKLLRDLVRDFREVKNDQLQKPIDRAGGFDETLKITHQALLLEKLLSADKALQVEKLLRKDLREMEEVLSHQIKFQLEKNPVASSQVSLALTRRLHQAFEKKDVAWIQGMSQATLAKTADLSHQAYALIQPFEAEDFKPSVTDLENSQQAARIFIELGIEDGLKRAVRPLEILGAHEKIPAQERVSLLVNASRLLQAGGLTAEANRLLQQLEKLPLPRMAELCLGIQKMNQGEVAAAEKIFAALVEDEVAQGYLAGIRETRKHLRVAQPIVAFKAWLSDHQAKYYTQQEGWLDGILGESEAGLLRFKQEGTELARQMEEWMTHGGISFAQALQRALEKVSSRPHLWKMLLDFKQQQPDLIHRLSNPDLSDESFAHEIYHFAHRLAFRDGYFQAATQVAQLISNHDSLKKKAASLLQDKIPSEQKIAVILTSLRNATVILAETRADALKGLATMVFQMGVGRIAAVAAEAIWATRAANSARLALRTVSSARTADRVVRASGWAIKSGAEALGFTLAEHHFDFASMGDREFWKKWAGMMVTFGMGHATGMRAAGKGAITQWMAGWGSFLAADYVNEYITGFKEKTHEELWTRVIHAITGDASMRLAGAILNKATFGALHHVEHRIQKIYTENLFASVLKSRGFAFERDLKGNLTDVGTQRVVDHLVQKFSEGATQHGFDLVSHVEQVEHLYEGITADAISQSFDRITSVLHSESSLSHAAVTVWMMRRVEMAASHSQKIEAVSLAGIKTTHQLNKEFRQVLKGLDSLLQMAGNLSPAHADKWLIEILFSGKSHLEINELSGHFNEVHGLLARLGKSLQEKLPFQLLRVLLNGEMNAQEILQALHTLAEKVPQLSAELKNALALDGQELAALTEQLLLTATALATESGDLTSLPLLLNKLTHEQIFEINRRREMQAVLEKAEREKTEALSRVQSTSPREQAQGDSVPFLSEENPPASTKPEATVRGANAETALAMDLHSQITDFNSSARTVGERMVRGLGVLTSAVSAFGVCAQMAFAKAAQEVNVNRAHLFEDIQANPGAVIFALGTGISILFSVRYLHQTNQAYRRVEVGIAETKLMDAMGIEKDDPDWPAYSRWIQKQSSDLKSLGLAIRKIQACEAGLRIEKGVARLVDVPHYEAIIEDNINTEIRSGSIGDVSSPVHDGTFEAHSDQGRGYSHNEDAVARGRDAFENAWTIVLDEMGACSKNGRASKLAVQAFAREMAMHGDLKKAFERAGKAMKAKFGNADCAGVAYRLVPKEDLSGFEMELVYLGDPGFNLLRKDGSVLSIREHARSRNSNLKSELVFVDEAYDREELEGRKRGDNYVPTRSLACPNGEIEVLKADVFPGDRIMACSDGLSDSVSSLERGRIASETINPSLEWLAQGIRRMNVVGQYQHYLGFPQNQGRPFQFADWAGNGRIMEGVELKDPLTNRDATLYYVKDLSGNVVDVYKSGDNITVAYEEIGNPIPLQTSRTPNLGFTRREFFRFLFPSEVGLACLINPSLSFFSNALSAAQVRISQTLEPLQTAGLAWIYATRAEVERKVSRWQRKIQQRATFFAASSAAMFSGMGSFGGAAFFAPGTRSSIKINPYKNENGVWEVPPTRSNGHPTRVTVIGPRTVKYRHDTLIKSGVHSKFISDSNLPNLNSRCLSDFVELHDVTPLSISPHAPVQRKRDFLANYLEQVAHSKLAKMKGSEGFISERETETGSVFISSEREGFNNEIRELLENDPYFRYRFEVVEYGSGPSPLIPSSVSSAPTQNWILYKSRPFIKHVIGEHSHANYERVSLYWDRGISMAERASEYAYKNGEGLRLERHAEGYGIKDLKGESLSIFKIQNHQKIKIDAVKPGEVFLIEGRNQPKFLARLSADTATLEMINTKYWGSDVNDAILISPGDSSEAVMKSLITAIQTHGTLEAGLREVHARIDALATSSSAGVRKNNVGSRILNISGLKFGSPEANALSDWLLRGRLTVEELKGVADRLENFTAALVIDPTRNQIEIRELDLSDCRSILEDNTSTHIRGENSEPIHEKKAPAHGGEFAAASSRGVEKSFQEDGMIRSVDCYGNPFVYVVDEIGSLSENGKSGQIAALVFAREMKVHGNFQIAYERAGQVMSQKTEGDCAALAYRIIPKSNEPGKYTLEVIYQGDVSLTIRKADGSLYKTLEHYAAYPHQGRMTEQVDSTIVEFDPRPELEARLDPENRRMTKSLRSLEGVDPLEFSLEDGDVIIVTTDGVSDSMSTGARARVAWEATDALRAAIALVQKALFQMGKALDAWKMGGENVVISFEMDGVGYHLRAEKRFGSYSQTQSTLFVLYRVDSPGEAIGQFKLDDNILATVEIVGAKKSVASKPPSDPPTPPASHIPPLKTLQPPIAIAPFPGDYPYRREPDGSYGFPKDSTQVNVVGPVNAMDQLNQYALGINHHVRPTTFKRYLGDKARYVQVFYPDLPSQTDPVARLKSIKANLESAPHGTLSEEAGSSVYICFDKPELRAEYEEVLKTDPYYREEFEILDSGQGEKPPIALPPSSKDPLSSRPFGWLLYRRKKQTVTPTGAHTSPLKTSTLHWEKNAQGHEIAEYGFHPELGILLEKTSEGLKVSRNRSGMSLWKEDLNSSVGGDLSLKAGQSFVVSGEVTPPGGNNVRNPKQSRTYLVRVCEDGQSLEVVNWDLSVTNGIMEKLAQDPTDPFDFMNVKDRPALTVLQRGLLEEITRHDGRVGLTRLIENLDALIEDRKSEDPNKAGKISQIISWCGIKPEEAEFGAALAALLRDKHTPSDLAARLDGVSTFNLGIRFTDFRGEWFEVPYEEFGAIEGANLMDMMRSGRFSETVVPEHGGSFGAMSDSGPYDYNEDWVLRGRTSKGVFVIVLDEIGGGTKDRIHGEASRMGGLAMYREMMNHEDLSLAATRASRVLDMNVPAGTDTTMVAYYLTPVKGASGSYKLSIVYAGDSGLVVGEKENDTPWVTMDHGNDSFANDYVNVAKLDDKRELRARRDPNNHSIKYSLRNLPPNSHAHTLYVKAGAVIVISTDGLKDSMGSREQISRARQFENAIEAMDGISAEGLERMERASSCYGKVMEPGSTTDVYDFEYLNEKGFKLKYQIKRAIHTIEDHSKPQLNGQWQTRETGVYEVYNHKGELVDVYKIADNITVAVEFIGPGPVSTSP